MIPWRYHCTLVEAPDQHGMLPTSSQDRYKMFDNRHMLQMGRGINHHVVTATLLGQEIYMLLKIQVAPEWEMWLRHQTSMECFPHPLKIYKEYFTTLICCRWTAISIIILLPSHSLVKKFLYGWKSQVAPEWEMIPWSIGSCPRPAWNASHIHSR